MSSTFAAPPHDLSTADPGPMVICDIRFTKVRGRIPVGRGEATDSLAMPFARVVSKSSFDLGTYGAEVVASVPSDTATKCSPLPLHQDDSGVDDR